jgi:hypothetical protein
MQQALDAMSRSQKVTYLDVAAFALQTSCPRLFVPSSQHARGLPSSWGHCPESIASAGLGQPALSLHQQPSSLGCICCSLVPVRRAAGRPLLDSEAQMGWGGIGRRRLAPMRCPVLRGEENGVPYVYVWACECASVRVSFSFPPSLA